MRKLVVFNHVSLDGFFVDANGDMNWAKGGRETKDAEWDAFVTENAGGNAVLVFGRVTYELMTRYWPMPLAAQHDPAVAERINNLSKVVFSKTLDKVSWSNTQLVKGDMVEEVRKMKAEPGEDLVILGSGNIVSQLATQGLIDEYQVVVNPIVLGRGRTLFESLKGKLKLRLAKSRTFNNGNVYLCYEPATK